MAASIICWQRKDCLVSNQQFELQNNHTEIILGRLGEQPEGQIQCWGMEWSSPGQPELPTVWEAAASWGGRGQFLTLFTKKKFVSPASPSCSLAQCFPAILSIIFLLVVLPALIWGQNLSQSLHPQTGLSSQVFLDLETLLKSWNNKYKKKKGLKMCPTQEAQYLVLDRALKERRGLIQNTCLRDRLTAELCVWLFGTADGARTKFGAR